MTELDFVGQNIRVLRRRMGMTLSELAEKIGIQEGPLGRVERGLNAPSAKVIFNLSKTLGVTTDAIFAESTVELQKLRDQSSDRPCFTSMGRPELPAKEGALANTVIDSFMALEDLCGAQKHAGIPFQLFFYQTEEGLENLAASVRNFLGIQNGIVFDYAELLESYGFRVVVCPMKELSSFSYFDAHHQNAFFFVNEKMNPERQLFSLAYELGMIYMWGVFMNRQGGTDKQWDADKAARKFAAFFLMPREAVVATVKQLGIDKKHWSYDLLLRIKYRFGVSAESFLYRLRELELISEESYRVIKAQILAHYEETNHSEPGSSRPLMTPNGRLWDLVLTARNLDVCQKELAEIETELLKLKLSRNA